MGDKEWSPADLFDVFGDRIARRILVLASGGSVSAGDLAEVLDVSHPTIYRRLNTLVDYDLVREHQGVDPSGNHYRTFETTIRSGRFRLEEDGFTIEIQVRQSIADQFDGFLSDMETPRGSGIFGESQRNEDAHHG